MLRYICTNLIFNMAFFKKGKKNNTHTHTLTLSLSLSLSLTHTHTHTHTCISLYIHPEHTAINLQYNSYNNITSFQRHTQTL